MKLSAEDLAQVNAAVSAAGSSIDAQDRFDLRQEVVIKLLQIEMPNSVHAWALTAARRWVDNFLRDQRLRRELVSEGKPRGAVQTYRKGPNWYPTWYPPNQDAQEFAPFALEGARVMHVGGKRP